MTDRADAFIALLHGLAERDRGALAHLKRSLAFAPGAYPGAYPWVERFVGADRHADDPWRKALYLVAGLFALHPVQQKNTPFSAAFGQVARNRDSASIEQRFLTLLSADPDELPSRLRQAVTLLAADGAGCDYAGLLEDLARWLDPFAPEARDRIRQRWARDFYSIQSQPAGEHAGMTSELTR